MKHKSTIIENNFLSYKLNPISEYNLFTDYVLEILGETQKAIKCSIFYYDMKTNEILSTTEIVWLAKSQLVLYEIDNTLYINQKQFDKYLKNQFIKNNTIYKEYLNDIINNATNKIYY